MLTLKYLYIRPYFETPQEALDWDKLQKTIATVKQFHDDFDRIVLHKDLFRTFYYYYLQEIRLRIIKVLMNSTTIEWCEPKPETVAVDQFGFPLPETAKQKSKKKKDQQPEDIPEYTVRVKGYKEKFPLVCCDDQFRTLAALRLHYYAVHEKTYLLTANTCEVCLHLKWVL
ncbi:AGAP003773-PA-like protein [Anopheles sinensis]|uniref:AGAP003773-PA-like protein n=1 Tax=Anopheles sinensis TaxID=74873 RepID=A0A084VGL6_ANOSI|nr:AGAP003773-PA-like protein [Anopheles sinensis]